MPLNNKTQTPLEQISLDVAFALLQMPPSEIAEVDGTAIIYQSFGNKGALANLKILASDRKAPSADQFGHFDKNKDAIYISTETVFLPLVHFRSDFRFQGYTAQFRLGYRQWCFIAWKSIFVIVCRSFVTILLERSYG